uniref:Uncharacterized protein n=1 Tax=Trichobilharzia regenti TaxID=157069 RepID=A0AA85JW21_TRIRE|nr:unnamed protein product [Trichobilharzia regenti]
MRCPQTCGRTNHTNIGRRIQLKCGSCQQQIRNIYKFLQLYSRLDVKNKCNCNDESIHAFIHETNKMLNEDLESSLMKEVEDVLSKAHITLLPQTQGKSVALLESEKSMSKSERRRTTCESKTQREINTTVVKQKKYIPAHMKAPYKADILSKRQPVKLLRKVKKYIGESKEHKIVECNEHKKSIQREYAQNMHRVIYSHVVCTCSQIQTGQEATLVRQLDKDFLRLRTLLLRTEQLGRWEDGGILLKLYRKAITASVHIPTEKCIFAGGLLHKFFSFLQFIDTQIENPDEICWIQSVLSRFIYMLNTLKLIVSRVDCGSMNTRVSSKYSDHDSSAEDDPVSAWFASRQPLKSFVPPNAYEAYMTIGRCSSKSRISRLSALKLYPYLCIFKGNKKEIQMFTNLWSELESIQIDLEFLNTFKSNLPELLPDLFDHTESLGILYFG